MKQNKIKRLFSLLLALALLLTLLPQVAPVARARTYSGTCGDNLTWTLDSYTGALTIEGSGAMTDYSFSSAWYRYRELITSVSLPEGLTSVGSFAFIGCTGLTEVTIPENVTIIGRGAFYQCSGLTEVTIPGNVTSIGNNSFYKCTGLTSVTIQEGVAAIGDDSFYQCTSLSSITISEGVTSIGRTAFFECTGLTGIVIPESVTSIGDRAFLKCTGLTRFIVKDGNSNFFADADGVLFNVEGPTLVCYPGGKSGSYQLPSSVSSIGEYAFSGCTELSSVTLQEGVASIGEFAFSGCTGLSSVTLPDSLVTICNGAFSSCSALTEIILPAALQVLGTGGTYSTGVFQGCNGLTEMTIPEGVSSIGDGAFSACTGLTSVTICEGVAAIGSSAFSGCTALTSVTIPNSVASIGYAAFSRCKALTSVTIPDSVTSIGNSAFQSCTGLTSVTIPEGVTSIGESAFCNCTGLTSVTIPEGVTSIGESAFCNCTGLTSVTIPESITMIGGYAFTGCMSLMNMVFHGNQAYIKTMVWETEETAEDLTLYDSGKNMLGPHEQVVVYGPGMNCDGDFHTEMGHNEDMMLSDMSPRYYAEKFGYTFYATDVFEDVRQGKYYTIPVAWAYGRGITNGKDDTHFGPNETCTRGQVVTFLWNAMGKPAPTITDCPFVDVKPGKYYYDAMLWALETGITSGKDDTHFAPNETCTRGQVVTFIWNAMGKPEPTITDCPFVDAKPGKYYYNAMLWALENGVTSGTDATHFSPNQTCTRGQVVTFLCNTLS